MNRTILLLSGVLFTTLASAQSHPVKDDDEAAVRAAALTAQYHLTTIKTECLYFDTKDEGKDYLVQVREKHSLECGGTPETSPTSFFMRLRKSDGHATTTAYNLDGNFEELRTIVKGDLGKSRRPPALSSGMLWSPLSL